MSLKESQASTIAEKAGAARTRLDPRLGLSGQPRVLLADDHGIITEGLRRLLEPECEVISTVGDGYSLIKAALALHPDVVVVNITMPLLNGIDATHQLISYLPKTHVIFLTMHADRTYVAEAFDAGAEAFVVKHAAPSELWQAINAVLTGSIYISPLVGGAGVIVDKQRTMMGPASAAYRLSTRQRQVLQLIAEGHSVKEIGSRLKLAPKTVEFHKYRIMKGLGFESTAQLIQFAVKHGLIA